MKILVISGCSKDQETEPLPAAKLYIGDEHKYVMEGLKKVREHPQYGEATVDLYIISTKYGLVNECDIIDPYNVKNDNAVWKQSPYYVNKKVLSLIHNYNLVFFLLKQDLEALQLAGQSFEYSGPADLVFLTAPTHSKNYLPPHLARISNIHVVNTGKSLAKNVLGGSQRTIGGFVFKKLCEMACSQGFNVFEDVKKNPWLIPDIARNQ